MVGPLSWLLASLAVLAVQASVLTLQSPRLTVSSSDAAQLRSEPLSLAHKVTPPVELRATDTLKLTFQIVDEDGKGVQPHQTFVRFYDEVTGEEGIQPVKVTAGGKAKLELNMARPPSSLPPSGKDPIKVSLYLGSFKHDPAQYELFDLFVPPSQPPAQHADEVFFHPRPEIFHTFRPEQKVPPKFVSAVFTLLLAAPWVVLLGLLAHIGPQVPYLFSSGIFPFIATLGAFEGLLVWYWVDLHLGQVLLYGAILSIPTAIAGKRALAAVGERRLGKSSPK
ncbi:oligosaccharyl transferase delta subunit [Dichomitus squalens]|uniref:Ribophorin II n=1 Tax=Dichomitus squalens TaxID=114155 RepID=A0A4Q9MED4_9APHY|nr:oligosaccharyl transferase delta subunit [Dichomitus squalens]TBU43898.1 oligosaccharyl transferase delta subunit [Dichomitus squalens]TBU60448.1 oligosaccharyl transferase delta subunit [Dichomitus squalens]